MERIVDLSDEPASLSVRYGQLQIRVGDRVESIPLDELLALVIAQPAVRLTQAVLSGICEQGGSLVICGRNRAPVGMILPLGNHIVQSERLERQLALSVPRKKQVWQQIIRAKITAQARVLANATGSDAGLEELAARVLVGDQTNCEAQASRRYWQALFTSAFRRQPEGIDGLNVHLNYGYGILRALVTRAICAVGMHPSLGIHHHNRYDAFCLADDLMEPFRPLVDSAVLEISRSRGQNPDLDKQSKTILIGRVAIQRYNVKGEERRLFDIVSKTAASLIHLGRGSRARIYAPVLIDAQSSSTPF